MYKTIIKEIALFLLLLIVIALLLGVLFYDYMPNTKTIPAKVIPYQIPNEIQEEINSSVAEGDNIIKTYTIDSTDLNLYENSNQYDKGKANPFERYASEEPINNNTVNNNTSGGNTNTNNTNTNTNSSNNNSGNFYDDEGK